MGALGPLRRLSASVLLRAASVALAVTATTGCRPASGGVAAPEAAFAPEAGAAPAPATPPSATEEAASDPNDLSGANDDFAALAYALHGVERPHDEDHDAAEEADGPEEHEGDDEEVTTDWNPSTTHPRSPLAELSADEIKRRLKDDPASLGSISIGATNRGALFNGVQVPAGDHWSLTDPGNAYGTAESVEQLIRCIEAVNEKYPKTQKMIIGHFSARRGGKLRPHRSHQAGRDVDVSYYYLGDKAWYSTATAQNLDRARTWAFVKALLTKADVEMILIDSSVQRLLRDHAIASGEDRQFVDRVFQVSGNKTAFAPIRHAAGHATHIHIRFRSPIAVASGQVAAAYLPKPKDPTRERSSAKHAVAQNERGAKDERTGKDERKDGSAKAKPGRNAAPKEEVPAFVMHRARSGDTLDALARRYGTTVQAIREANGLKGNALKEKHTYKIPVARPGGDARPAGGPAKRKG